MGERQKTAIRKLKKLRAEKFLAFSCDGSCAERHKKKLIPKIIALGVGPPVTCSAFKPPTGHPVLALSHPQATQQCNGIKNERD